MQDEITPQHNMIREKVRRAPTFSSIRLLGTSMRTYPTANMPAASP